MYAACGPTSAGHCRFAGWNYTRSAHETASCMQRGPCTPIMQNAHSIVTETTSSSAPSPQKTCFEHPPLGVELAFRRLNWKDVQILFTARVRHAEGVRWLEISIMSCRILLLPGCNTRRHNIGHTMQVYQ